MYSLLRNNWKGGKIGEEVITLKYNYVYNRLNVSTNWNSLADNTDLFYTGSSDNAVLSGTKSADNRYACRRIMFFKEGEYDGNVHNILRGDLFSIMFMESLNANTPIYTNAHVSIRNTPDDSLGSLYINNSSTPRTLFKIIKEYETQDETIPYGENFLLFTSDNYMIKTQKANSDYNCSCGRTAEFATCMGGCASMGNILKFVPVIPSDANWAVPRFRPASLIDNEPFH